MSTAFYTQPTSLFIFLFIVIYVFSSCFLCLEFSSALHANSHSLTSFKFLLKFNFLSPDYTDSQHKTAAPTLISVLYIFLTLLFFSFHHTYHFLISYEIYLFIIPISDFLPINNELHKRDVFLSCSLLHP